MIVILAVLTTLPYVSSFLFGNSGCRCTPCAVQSSCPAQPTCPPVQKCPVTECCPTCSCRNKERIKRSNTNLAPDVYIADVDVVSNKHEIMPRREKRNILDEVVKVDAKCNSEDLRSIIIENIDRVTSISKRRIQVEAESRLGGRYNVICARGDFSYITNTEEYCQQTIGDITCYAFKQLSDVLRARL